MLGQLPGLGTGQVLPKVTRSDSCGCVPGNRKASNQMISNSPEKRRLWNGEPEGEAGIGSTGTSVHGHGPGAEAGCIGSRSQLPHLQSIDRNSGLGQSASLCSDRQTPACEEGAPTPWPLLKLPWLPRAGGRARSEQAWQPQPPPPRPHHIWRRE